MAKQPSAHVRGGSETMVAVAPRWLADGRRGGALPVWTRAVAAEILPDPVLPLEHDLLWAASARPAWCDLLVDEHGFTRSELPEDGTGLIGFFDGYAYLNASLIRVWANRVPVMPPIDLDQAYLGHHPDLPPHSAEPWQLGPEQEVGRQSRWLHEVLVERDQTALEADHHDSVRLRAMRPDLARLGDRELFAHITADQPLARRLFARYLSQTLAASVGPGIVSAMCHDVGLPGVHTQLMAGLGDVDGVAPAQALWTLSRLVRSSSALTDAFAAGRSGLLNRIDASSSVDAIAFLAGFEVLMSEVGFVGPAEWEPASPSWESEPGLLLSGIDWMRRCDDQRDPSIGFARCESERITLAKEVGDLIAGRSGTTTRERFDAAMAATAVFVRGRDRSKSSLSRVVNESRMAIRELAQRAKLRGDIERTEDLHLLFAEELRNYVEGGLANVSTLVAERRAVHAEAAQREPPFVIAGVGAQQPGSLLSAMLGEVVAMVEGEVLLAEPGSAGRTRGIARIVSDVVPTGFGVTDLSAADFRVAEGAGADRFRPGDIVVTRAASSASLPYAIGMSALVVESGTLLSPAAVMGRELGLPVVVGALDATTRIPEGALVEVDGQTGIVTLIEPPDQVGAPLVTDFASERGNSTLT